MRSLIVSLLILLALAARAEAMPRDWRDADLGQAIIEGVADRDHIWLRGSTRKVVRFVRATGERTVVAEDVVDLLPDNGRLWLLGQRSGTNQYYVVNLLDPVSAAGVGSAQRRGDRQLHPGEEAEGQVLGLVSWPGLNLPSIVTQRGILPLSQGLRRQHFAGSLSPHARLAAVDERSVYAGYNRGEWGGGLRRVDIPTGSISFVTEEGDNLCDGALNPACEPIVGLFRDPARPGCVIVGSGISHLGLSKGQVYRVCGSVIEPVFSTPTPLAGDQWMMGRQPWPLDGLFETPDGWIGVSRDRYFRSHRGRVEEMPMPQFRDWAGLLISDEQNGVLFVVSACCWGSAENPTLYRAMVITVGG